MSTVGRGRRAGPERAAPKGAGLECCGGRGYISRPRPHAPALSSAGIAVGFYGNGETSDGIHRATYSLRHANRTVAGVQDRVSDRGVGAGALLLLRTPCLREAGRGSRGWGCAGRAQPLGRGGRAPNLTLAGPAQVWDTAVGLNHTAEPSLQTLEQQLAGRPEPLRAVQRLQGLLETLLGYTAAIPFWRNTAVSLEVLAEQVDLYDWYRCGQALLPAQPHLGEPYPPWAGFAVST